MRNYIVCLAPLFLIWSVLNTTYAQSGEELPEFLKMKRMNFHKIKRKAERHFKNQEKEREELEDLASDGFERSLKASGREEDNDYHRYKRWEWFWRHRVHPDGSFPDQLKVHEAYMNLQAGAGQNFRMDDINPTWTSIGFTKNDGGYWGMGQARSVAIFPGNPAVYYVTTVGGGIWKTTNGGKNYFPIGDKLPALFCGKVIVHPTDANTVYVNVGGTGEWWLPGLGVYKSMDGGITWNVTGLSGTRANGINVEWFEMSPTDPNVLIAATNLGLYRTSNAGKDWQQVRPGEHGHLVFRPQDGTTVYAATNDYYAGSEIYRSTDAGLTWAKVSNWGYKQTKILLAVSLSDKEFVAASVNNNGTRELYTSTNRGASFDNKMAANNMDSDVFYLSQVNKNTMYCGAVNVKRSDDGGNNWNEISNWCCGTSTVPEVHADNHGVTHNPTNYSEIYFCNDGGVDKYNESTHQWTRLSNGLVITMYYRIASAQTNDLVISGATQDNGGNKRNADGTWRNTTGGDATMAMIDPTNENVQYSSYVNGDGITRTDNGWGSTTDLTPSLRSAGAVGGDWATPFALDKSNPKVVLAGYQDVLRSTDKGVTWSKISNNLTGGVNLQHIIAAPSDGNVIYCSKDGNLYRTYNLGSTWTTIPSPSGSITGIEVNPNDSKKIYVTTNGGNGKRVYVSTNGGNTWSNSTLNIPNDVNVNCLVYEKGSNEGLYVGTAVGVFYKNASLTQWVYFGMGLPNSEINDISIGYSAKKLRVGTWGRGIWETDLYSSGTVTALENSNEQVNASPLTVYPNPFVEGFYIPDAKSGMQLRILSMEGLLLGEPAISSTGLIRADLLSKGTYVLELMDKEGNKMVRKIVKE
jgi:photosystem II stability/assembly factor-like uncharacterized protein